MSELVLRTDFTPQSFAPFGEVIRQPAEAGERRFFSEFLGSENPACRPVFHTNLVKPASLPHRVNRLEQHPHANQAFVPLDVSRYLVVVAPSNNEGQPLLDGMEAFLVPGHLGVIYRAGVWHAGASVLDRSGSFAVLMWRGAEDDDVFLDVPATSLIAPERALEGAL